MFQNMVNPVGGSGGGSKLVEETTTFSTGNNTITISELSNIKAVVIETTSYSWVSFAYYDDTDNLVIHSGYSTYWNITGVNGNQITFYFYHPNYSSMSALITVIGE